MNPEQEQKIRQHGLQLQAIFPATKDMDPIKLCKVLRRLEITAHRAALDWCNGDIDEADFNITSTYVLSTLNILLSPTRGEVVFINSDPRGYALKIDDEYMRANNWQLHRDMGGYGIIAPEIN